MTAEPDPFPARAVCEGVSDDPTPRCPAGDEDFYAERTAVPGRRPASRQPRAGVCPPVPPDQENPLMTGVTPATPPAGPSPARHPLTRPGPAPGPEAAARIIRALREHPCWSAFWDKRHRVWRVADDDPDSGLYAESSDADTVISYIRAHS